MIKLKFRKTKPEAIQPTYATDGSACIDLYSTTYHLLEEDSRVAVIDTGIAFEIPKGYVMTVFSRSGHGFRKGVRLSNGTGIIDSDFRDSVKISLIMDSFFRGAFEINPGDRIAQAMIIPTPLICLEEVSELSETERGMGGLGSTGS
ncbi:dUTP diphosphatase [Nitrosomonas sp. Nm34]|uniref:dUTP diphosphatase n=1 Tax=Nitrosomonas sp. Nm34 TaxID=1881055 RepID=UPI0008F1A7F7|nr:dUTP diphosphatase [Nitrosomonas sp. Nm34]SFI74849.1 dUTP pyrophosphatase [Nitrosomonas sp. Nm34]